MTFLYFAYGSNMLSSRLQLRCPSANKVETATAAGYELNFSKLSKDKSGKGALVKNEKSIAEGVLFEISKSELPKLDAAEGKGYGYERVNDFRVTTKDGRIHNTTSYLPQNTNDQLKPYDWYLALVLAGAMENSVSKEYLHKLKYVSFIHDPINDRKTKLEAIEALKLAGFPKWDKLFGA